MMISAKKMTFSPPSCFQFLTGIWYIIQILQKVIHFTDSHVGLVPDGRPVYVGSVPCSGVYLMRIGSAERYFHLIRATNERASPCTSIVGKISFSRTPAVDMRQELIRPFLIGENHFQGHVFVWRLI